SAADLQMNAAGLYREEVVTDRRVGSIRILTPVTAEGLADATRKVLYVGEAQMLTPGGVLPLAFEIDAGSLSEAIQKFASGADAPGERAVQELEALRRPASSSILVPGGPGGRVIPRAPRPASAPAQRPHRDPRAAPRRARTDRSRS